MASSNSKKKGKKKAPPPAKKASGGGGGAAKKKSTKKSSKSALEVLNDHCTKTKAKKTLECIKAGPNNSFRCKISYSNQLVTIEGMGEGKTKKQSQQQAAVNILNQLRERGLVPSSSIDAPSPTSAAQMLITPRENNLPPLAKKSGVGVDTKKKSAKKKSSKSSSGSSIDATTTS